MSKKLEVKQKKVKKSKGKASVAVKRDLLMKGRCPSPLVDGNNNLQLSDLNSNKQKATVSPAQLGSNQSRFKHMSVRSGSIRKPVP